MGTTNRNVIMLNKETENMTILQGHKQKVTQVIYHQNEVKRKHFIFKFNELFIKKNIYY